MQRYVIRAYVKSTVLMFLYNILRISMTLQTLINPHVRVHIILYAQ